MNSLETPSDTWYLKAGDGEIFGPVTLRALQRWAASGRVTPDSLLSTNREKWRPAHLLEDLAMNCVVRVRPGTFYGPVHAGAVDAYARDGVIPKNAAVYIAHTGKTPPGPGETNPPAEAFGAKIKETQSQRQHDALLKAADQLAQMTAGRDDARRQAEDLKTALQNAGDEIQRLTAALADAQALHADAEARLKDALARRDAAVRAGETLAIELELLRDKQSATALARDEHGATLARFRATAGTLAEQLRRLAADCAEPLPFPPETGGHAPAPAPRAAGNAAFVPSAAASPLARLESLARAELAKLNRVPPPACIPQKSAP